MFIYLLKKFSRANWALADQAMVSGVNFLTGLLLARLLGISEFGVFTLIWMGVLFANSIQMALISSPMMSIGPKLNESEQRDYFSALLMQQALFSIATFCFLYLGVYVAGSFKPEWGIGDLALPLASAGFFFQNQDFVRRYFFCKQRAVDAFWNDAISYLGQMLLLVFLFYTSEPIVSEVLWVVGATSALAVIFGLKKFDFNLVDYIHFEKVMKRNFRISKWLTASAIMQWTSGNLFILVAGAVLGSSAVGILKAAQNVIGITHILFQALENVVPINASLNFGKKGVAGLLKYLREILLFGGSAIAVICFLVGFFADEILFLTYGETYTQYGYVLQWYSVVYMVVFMCLPIRAGLRTFEVTRPIFIAYILMTVFSFSFSTLMVEEWGLTGVLVGILGTQIIMIVTLFISFKHQVAIAKKVQ